MAEWCRRELSFSGHQWLVKGSDTRVGPGPNLFSDGDESAWVDSQGRLHLKINQKDGLWRCAEVISRDTFGYGKWTFHLAAGAERINENVVLGMFTWDNDPAYHNREIDIELSRWGQIDDENCQFVVQPYERPGNTHRFNARLEGADSTHSFDWRQESITFRSLRGSQVENNLIEAWTYTGPDIPPPGRENARINLWLFRGSPPSDSWEVEVVVTKFEFAP